MLAFLRLDVSEQKSGSLLFSATNLFRLITMYDDINNNLDTALRYSLLSLE